MRGSEGFVLLARAVEAHAVHSVQAFVVLSHLRSMKASHSNYKGFLPSHTNAHHGTYTHLLMLLQQAMFSRDTLRCHHPYRKAQCSITCQNLFETHDRGPSPSTNTHIRLLRSSNSLFGCAHLKVNMTSRFTTYDIIRRFQIRPRTSRKEILRPLYVLAEKSNQMLFFSSLSHFWIRKFCNSDPLHS